MFVEKAFVSIFFEFFSPVLEGPQTQGRSRGEDLPEETDANQWGTVP